MGSVRVRFAPSPTGYLHIGGARTALFNWLFARHNDGKMVLRIEDTDQGRLKEDSVSQIISSLKWLGISWDEGPETGGDYGPYFQSERLDKYTKECERLMAEGKAYYCFCTSEELEADKEADRKARRPHRYSGRCRNLTDKQIEKYKAEGRKPVVRFKMPEGSTVVKDIVRGDVTFDNNLMDDFVIMKSNGIPTYNFAVVVDDHSMGMTHVIRGEEHLPNTPKQVLLYDALGYETPKFAHVPMILAPDKSKLSKRHGATSVEEFRDKGFLPEAIVNYLILLGWSPEGNTEIITLEDAAEQFSLKRVNKSSAIYDVTKLTWINGVYMRELPLEDVVGYALPFYINEGLIPEDYTEQDLEKVKSVADKVREREKTLVDLAKASSYFFKFDYGYEEKGVKKFFKKEGAADVLKSGLKALSSLDEFTAENAEKAYRGLIAESGIKSSKLFHPTRLALSGRTIGPGLFDIMILLGKEETLKRMEKAINYIESL
mgnify:FL=1